MQAVTKDMIIRDIIAIHPGNAAILMASGMGCIGCPASQEESLEEAAMVHGLDSDILVKDINEFMETQEQRRAERDSRKA